MTMLVAPVIPMINDREIEAILEAGKKAGARAANYIFLRLPLEISELFQAWLEAHFPDRAEHVMSLVRQSRRGADYRSEFHTRMSAEGLFAEMIGKRFRNTVKRLGLDGDERFELDSTRFRGGNRQLDLF